MGVAFREFNDTLKASPWFNKHGHFSKSEEKFLLYSRWWKDRNWNMDLKQHMLLGSKFM